MTRGSRRTHLRKRDSIYTNETECGIRLPAMYLWRMRDDAKMTTCKRCRTKFDQRKARAE